jgi:hypothetical protein
MTCDMPRAAAAGVLDGAGFATWALAEPQYFVLPSPWAGHIPFAFWLIPTLRPGVLVDLGASDGNAYMSFCQAVAQHGLPSKAFAVRSGNGPEAADGEDIARFRKLQRAHDPRFGGFSELLRVRADEALLRFSNGSIDLLHVGNPGTYEAGHAVFEAWLPKLSKRAVVLVHHVNVIEPDAGVDRFWDELARRYPSFKFSHGDGLGVVLVGEEQASQLLALSSRAGSEGPWPSVRQFFQVVGARLETRADIETLSLQAAQANVAVERLQIDAHQAGMQLRNLEAKLHKRDQAIVELRNLVGEGLDHIRQSEAPAVRALAEIRASRSWRLTAPYRAIGAVLKRGRTAIGRLLAFLVWGRVRLLIDPMAALPSATAALDAATLTPSLRSTVILSGKLRAARQVGILTAPHTTFVAHALRRALSNINLHAEILLEPPLGSFDKDLYFVLCPQTFARLPPGGKRICMQMEQSVNSRWFTPRYIESLAGSLSVFDYSMENLAYLHEKGICYPTTFFLPVGGVGTFGKPSVAEVDLAAPAQTPASREKVDVLFYGDIQNDRRRELLAKISEQFTTLIVSDLFGDALQAEIRRARVVVNLHYYDNALLETTRIYECLSLGARVVSEVGSDQAEHESLREAVAFVPVGDVKALLAAIRQVLDEAPEPRNASIRNVVQSSESRFNFMLYRALRALNVISNAQFDKLSQCMPLPGDKVALSLPETSSRHAWFKSTKPADVAVFEGVRAAPGWIGCGLSYRYLARKAVEKGADRLLICEDDVELGIDFEKKMKAVTRFLDIRAGHWDIFAGLIADLHIDVRIIAVEDFGGVTFVTVDKMTSMVYNIYARRALELIARWDPANGDIVTNTIDRYLENTATLRTVTTLPFVAGHRAGADSSLWGISNQSYVAMIERSQRLLADKVWEFRANRVTSALSLETEHSAV